MYLSERGCLPKMLRKEEVKIRHLAVGDELRITATRAMQVNYTITPLGEESVIVVDAIKERDKEIRKLKQRIARLEEAQIVEVKC
jgi:hypothetical protein